MRSRRAHAYLRRRVLNVLVLLLANAGAWVLVYALTRALFGVAILSPLHWAALIGLHSVLLYLGRLLPGWGLGIVSEVRSTVNLTTLLFVFVLTADFLDDRKTEYLWPALLSLLALIPLVLLARSLTKTLLLRRKQWGVPVVIYGAALTGERVVKSLQAERGLGYQPLALFDDDPAKLGQQIDGVPITGNTNSVNQEAPVAIVAMPGLSRYRLVGLLDGPLTTYRNVIVIPDLFEVQSLWATTHDLGGILGVHITHTLADPVQRRTKRALDLLAVTLTSPFWVPLCLLIGALIWLEDREKPIFLQRRVGLGGEDFDTLKFRTMVPNAEQVLQQRLAEDPALREEWEKNFKLRHDPRITRIGGLLRTTSLDELPQLVNVLRGEMSLVGPRPLPGYHQQELPQSVQQLRHEVRPGMTGLWQVSGRSDAGNEGMVQLDPYYVRNWSVWLDLVILLRTFRAVLRSAGAY